MNEKIVKLKYNKKTNLVNIIDNKGGIISDLEPEDFIITDMTGNVTKLLEVKYNYKRKGYEVISKKNSED